MVNFSSFVISAPPSIDQIFSGTGLPMSSGDQVWDCPILITPVFVSVSRKIFGFTIEIENVDWKIIFGTMYEIMIYNNISN